MFPESTPNGESIIAISASNPEIEKYLLNSYTSQRANPESSLLRSNFYYPEVGSYSKTGGKNNIATPENSIAGSGRNFGESRQSNPFFVPFLLPNLDGFQLNNWFRNIENLYEFPSYASDGEVKAATAVNDNSHIYGKVKSSHFDNKRP